MTSKDSPEASANIGAILGLVLSWGIYGGMFLFFSGPVVFYPYILKFGEQTVGAVEEKYETWGWSPHGFRLKVRFEANGQEHISNYGVHPIDYGKIYVGDSVELRYIRRLPYFFALEEYRQYSTETSFSLASISSLLVFATAFVFFGERINYAIKRMSVSLNVRVRVVEWIFAALCIFVILLFGLLVERMASPYPVY